MTDELDEIRQQLNSYLEPDHLNYVLELIAKECTKTKLDIAKLAAQMANDDSEYTLHAFAEDLENNTLRQDKEQL
jgi:hypothetical protein